MIVLGLSGGFHDAAAAVVDDGRILAAVEQERLSRRKHDAAFPADAVATCLAVAGIGPAEVDLVACHEKPLDVVGRHVASRLRSGPRAIVPLVADTPAVLATQLGLGRRIASLFADLGAPTPPVHHVPHHLSHAASAFYPSPFASAAILTVDGVGEWSTASIGHGHAHRIVLEHELRYPDSVGLLYAAFTAYCGMRPNGGEGELMGLAPYGTPRFADQILDEVVALHDDGSIRLDRRSFAFQHGRAMTSRRFHRRFGGPPRPLGSEPTEREADLAASIQAVLEEIVLAMAAEAHRRSGAADLVLAGGAALNCVANARVRRDGPFQRVWVQPAAGDAGGALGAALAAVHEHLEVPRPDPAGHDAMAGAFLGPAFGRDEVEAWAADRALAARFVPDDVERCAEVADRLASGAVVGWFTGPMEFGPRALGHRSILADPRSTTVRDRLNEAIKERARFRPFAPAVRAEDLGAWFEADAADPYMTFTAPVAAARRGAEGDGTIAERLDAVGGELPAVTHVDGSARVQAVDRTVDPRFAGLLDAFAARTGCPVLLNTSFNHRDEPIVATPDDALATFRRTGLDLLVVEHALVEAGS